ncbi:MAG: hypothetical protein INH37_07140, partial [Myxococcaceae bacterium]|nr:hypothetical protein [Myxococcaceae bacterium]
MRTWHLAHLTRRRLLDEGLVEVSLSVPPPVWEAFSRPGQFTRVRLAGSEAPFAIASP